MDVEEALACGLVTQVVAPEDLEEAVAKLVQRIAKGSPMALRLTKLAMRAPSSAHPEIDDLAQAVLFQSEEKQQRMDAFLNRGERS